MMSSDAKVLGYFSQMIEKEIGMVFKEDQYYQLRNRLEAVCSSFRYDGLEGFYQAAKKGLPPGIKTALLDIATNNETSFFRDKKVFNLIYKEVIPKLVEKNRAVDIWSVASSSGQEAYSISMLFEEWQENNKRLVNYGLLGTDISSEILQKAQAAEYSQFEAQRGLSTKLLLKYFDKTDSDRKPWRIKGIIREKVRYKQLNLVEKFSVPSQFDLVLCRNVLIYQSRERKKKILERISSYIRPGGYLVLGSGEILNGLDSFNTIHKDGAIIYQMKDGFQSNKAA